MGWNSNNTTTVFPRVGWTIDQAIEYAVDTAKRKKTTVEISINDILIPVAPGSKVATIKKVYLARLAAKSK